MSAWEEPGGTPDPVHVRVALLSLLALGLSLGFLAIVAARDIASSGRPGFGVALAGLGALLGGVFSSASASRWARDAIAFCAWAAAVSLVLLGLVAAGRWVPLTLLVLGFVCGASLRLVLALMLPMYPSSRSASLLGLAGATVGFGAMGASLVAMAASGPGIMDDVPMGAAIGATVLVIAALRARRVPVSINTAAIRTKPEVLGAGRGFGLLAGGLFLQTVGCALGAACCLAFLARTFGHQSYASAAVAALFWLALTVGWVVAVRVPSRGEYVRTLVLCVVLALGGAGLLVGHLGWPLAIFGVVAIGAALGALSPTFLSPVPLPLAMACSARVALTVRWFLPCAFVLGWGLALAGAAVHRAVLVGAMAACCVGASLIRHLLLLDMHGRTGGDEALT